jgi:uncharacterized transporter YbjL
MPSFIPATGCILRVVGVWVNRIGKHWTNIAVMLVLEKLFTHAYFTVKVRPDSEVALGTKAGLIASSTAFGGVAPATRRVVAPR